MKTELTFGQLIQDVNAPRDAVHVAVAPVIAAQILKPGEHIGFIGDGPGRVGRVENTLGVVDPYLRGPVFPGQRFWLFLYPQSITSLRHEWTHPAFTESALRLDEDSPKAQAELWLRSFAATIGMRYADLIDAIGEYAQTGEYHVFGYDTPSECWAQREDMWRHYEVLTGTTVPETTKDSTPFSCSC